MTNVADRFDEILIEMRHGREQHDAHMDRMQAQTDESIGFLGELNRRSEIVLREVLLSQADMRAEIRESVKEIKANTASTKAHTRAIFAVIDRLEGGGPAPRRA